MNIYVAVVILDLNVLFFISTIMSILKLNLCVYVHVAKLPCHLKLSRIHNTTELSIMRSIKRWFFDFIICFY